MDKFTKQPNDVLDYTIDLSKWMATGDTVTSANASVNPAGLNVSVTNDTTDKPKVWASGGNDGTTYQVTLTVNTNGGRTKEFEFKLAVAEI